MKRLLAALGALGMALAALGQGWNAVTDFTPTQNPGPQWSYGYRIGNNGAFTLMPLRGAFDFIDFHYDTGGAPSIGCNRSGSTRSTWWPNNTLAAHPGNNAFEENHQSVLRWTAPAAGIYGVTASFVGIDNRDPRTTVSVVSAGQVLWSGSINGTGTSAFATVPPIAATTGQTIDFVVANQGSATVGDRNWTQINANIGPSEGVVQADFEAVQSPYVLQQLLGASPATIQLNGPTGKFLRLNPAVSQVRNVIAFDRPLVGLASVIDFSFDFRIQGGADGFDLELLPTSAFGNSGFDNSVPGANRKIGLEFDIWNNGSGNGDPNDNHVSLWLAGTEVAIQANPGLDLNSGQMHRVYGRITFGPSSASLSASTVQDVHGPNPVVRELFSNVSLNTGPFESRPKFSAYCGGITANHDLDNISFTYRMPGTSIELTDAISRQVALSVPITDQATSGTDAISRQVTLFTPITDQATSGTDAISRQISLLVPITDQAVSGTDAISRQVTLGVPITDQAVSGIDAISRQLTVRADSPNLVVQNASAPTGVETDSAFVVTWTNQNVTPNTARGPWTDRILLSTTNSPTGAIAVADFPFAGDIPGNSGIQRAQIVTIPRSAVSASGNFWLIFAVDALNNVSEGPNEGDNWVAVPIQVTRNPLADLIASNLVAPATAVSGQSIQVQFTVQNTGNAPTATGFWRDAILVSEDNQPGADPIVVPINNVSYLPAGTGYTTVGTVTFPRTFFGNYKILGFADSSNSVVEENNANNFTTAQNITIQEAPYPDLQVVTATASSQGFAGETITANWRTENLGNVATLSAERPWTDSVFLSRDTQLSGDDPLIGQATYSAANLAVGAGYDANATCTLPPSAIGQFYVIVHTDSGNRVYESGLNGNNTRVTGQINVISTPPDLVVPTFTSVPTAVAGQTIPVDFTVLNQGAFEAKGRWSNTVYFSANATLEPSDVSLGTWERGPLAPGASTQIQAPITIPVCNQGRYYLIAKADSGNTLFEFDPNADAEANNTRVIPIDIADQSANLRYVSLSATPVALDIRNLLQINFQVENAGTGPTEVNNWVDRYYISPGPNLNGAVEIGQYARNAALLRGERYTDLVRLRVPSSVSSGTYWLIGVTDAGNAVEECNAEGDNLRNFGPITVTNTITASDPDLVIGNPTRSVSTVRPFETFNVGWSVSNSGPGAAEIGWNDQVFLSTDTVLSSNDILLENALRPNSLAVGANYTQSQTASVPFVAPGNYHLIYVADGGDNVRERSETNNVTTLPLTVSTYDYDLTVTTVTPGPNWVAGRIASVSWSVTNQGSTAIPASLWVDRVILSRDQVVDASDRVLGSQVRSTGLAAGANYTQSLSATLPAGLSGTHYVFVTTDADARIPESNENNNRRISAAFQIQLPPPVDLDVTGVTLPSTASPGEEATFEWTVTNTQPNPIDGQWEDGVYLSRDAVLSLEDVFLGSVAHSALVPANGTYSKSLTVEVPGIDIGNYHVLVRTDLRNTVAESNEINNLQASAGQVNLDVFELTLGQTHNSTLRTGQNRYYKVATPANETLWVTTDGSGPEMFLESYLKFGQMANLSNYEFQSTGGLSPNQNLLVPNTENGFYYNLTRATQATGNQPFAIKPRLLNFEIVDVSPRITGNAGFSTITVKGAKFDATDVVFIRKENTLLRPLVQRLSSTRVVAVFDLEGVATGSYDVVVEKQTGQQATMEGAVSVNNSVTPTPLIEMAAPSSLRVGAEAVLTVTVVNPSLNDIVSGILAIQIPNPAQAKPHPNLFGVTRFVDASLPEWYQESQPPYFDGPQGRMMYVYVPLLRQQSSASVKLSISETSVVQSIVVNAVFFGGQSPSELIEPEGSGLRSGEKPLLTACEAFWYGKVSGRAVEALVKRTLGGQISGPRCQQAIADATIAINTEILSAILLLEAQGKLTEKELIKELGSILPAITLTTIRGCAGDSFDALVRKLAARALPAAGWVLLGADVIDTLADVSKSVREMGEACPGKFKLKGNPQVGPGGIANIPPPMAGASKSVPVFRPVDPNDKVGPAGAGAEQWVSAGQVLPYTVNFENVPTATAAAGRVVITDTLDPNINPFSVRLGDIAFGPYVVSVPPGRAFFQGRQQLGPELGNMAADITAFLDIFTNTIIWTIQTVDPATGLPPLDPTLGVLPPNDSTKRGQGYVTYTVQPKATAPMGTILNNTATIVFDQEAPIITNNVFNTLDPIAPTSQVQALPVTQTGNLFQVQWTATDNVSGSGISQVELFVSANGGPYLLQEVIEDRTSTAFQGELGTDYRFFTVAVDRAGNREAAPTAADATTRTGDNPIPVLQSVIPTVLDRGVGEQEWRVRGQGFVRATVVKRLVGEPIPGREVPPPIPLETEYVSPTELVVRAALPDVTTIGLVAENPRPGGGISKRLAVKLQFPIAVTQVSRGRGGPESYRLGVSNPTGIPRFGVTITSLRVDGMPTSTPVPIAVGTIPARGAKAIDFAFPASISLAGKRMVVEGTFEGGVFRSDFVISNRGL